MDKVDCCFNSRKKMNVVNVSSDIKLKANNIQRLLQAHLHRNLNARVNNPKTRNHWSFQWARNNIYCIAAIMAMYDLVKNDVMVLDESATLLRTSNKIIQVGVDESNMHGAYLYYDTNDENRSVVVRRQETLFSIRNKAHEKCEKGYIDFNFLS